MDASTDTSYVGILLETCLGVNSTLEDNIVGMASLAKDHVDATTGEKEAYRRGFSFLGKSR
jgi:hypothetical protein